MPAPDNSFYGSTNLDQGFFQLSQAHLTLLTTCPRKFQHVYLDQLGLPSLPEEQERQTLGTRFHQLMQQRELGLPIKELLQADTHLQRWFSTFRDAPPPMLPGLRQSEHRRTLSWQNYLLTGIYDLLILGQQAQILDWKTYSRPQNPQWLQQSWQTRLYLYLLGETSEYRPEQISMTYWFAESQGKESEPPSLTFTYSAAHHLQTQKQLTQLLGNLTGWLESYTQNGSFPQVAIETGECQGRTTGGNFNGKALECRFASRCQRHRDRKTGVAPTTQIHNVQEVSL